MYLRNLTVLYEAFLLLLLLHVTPGVFGFDRSQIKILQGNDDGWAEANIRAAYKVFTQAGYQSLISAPTENKSGSGSFSAKPKKLEKVGEYNSIKKGSPGTGHDEEDDHIWYVNAFPLDGIRYGLDNLVEKYLGGNPQLVVTGPNVGMNVNIMDFFSGTLGAASYAANRGIPAIAISAAGGLRHSYKDSNAHDSSHIYAQASLRIIEALLQTPQDSSYLPVNTTLNVNLQAAGPGTNCQTASDYKFVLTTIHRVYLDHDLSHCGSNRLKSEASIIRRKSGCWASVSVLHNRFGGRANVAEQEYVRNRFGDFLSCP
ncbi:survival protein sure-like phosphatase/nucleotidase [Melampsora americana]|nr:survival protein sure-like phosphatase/nucleotidase [Melampsora americana]